MDTKKRKFDLISILIICLYQCFVMFIAEEYYGGFWAKVSSTMLMVCSIIYSWKLSGEYNHWVKFIICYIPIFVMSQTVNLILVDLFTTSNGILVNLLILIIFFTLWYIVIYRKIRTQSKALKGNENSKSPIDLSKVGSISLIIAILALFIFILSIGISIYVDFNFPGNSKLKQSVSKYAIGLIVITIPLTLIGSIFGIIGLVKRKKFSIPGFPVNFIYLSIFIFLIIRKYLKAL